MISHARLTTMTEQEYLDFEMKSPERHEYVAGQVFAMVGASRAHNLITGNLYSLLRTAARNKGCEAFITELKVRVRPARAYYYPDIVVTCGESDKDPYVISEAVLIVEVLSPSTEGIDRREKLLAYRQLDSLQEYVLAAQSRKHVEVYRRDAAGTWWHDEYEDLRAKIPLESVDVEVTLEEIYDGVALSSS
jgi:Uma2 family endonuclease